MGVSIDHTPAGRIALAVVSSFLVWFVYYNILCLRNPVRSQEWHCRVVTCTHAVIITTMSFTFGVFFNPWIFTDPGGPNTVYEVLTLTVCLGYFIFDFVWCLWFWGHESSLMMLHHVLSILSLALSLLYGVSGTEINATIFGTEVSNPLLQLRWFMRETGRVGTWYYEVNDFMFIATFFFFRVCIGTCLAYSHLLHPRPSKMFKLGGTGMYLVSWCFMLGILRFAFYKYSKLYRRWKEAGRAAPVSNVNGRHDTRKVLEGALDTSGSASNGHLKKED